MKVLLKFEEFGSLLLGIYLFSILDLNWWWFIGLFLAPDVSALGYLAGSKIGAWCYNFLHLKSLGILCYLLGTVFNLIEFQVAGLIIFSHAAFDRLLGYGLKYETGFKDTHLGKIGN
ncbi:DUF4260 domain-containing protein [Leeuwenhoekiella marinoflava]|uniref:DUF4260 domain-containing protein n=1 Tax=Leeuwenhoekiella marinoflava TaxID=988 RepID=UPI0030030674